MTPEQWQKIKSILEGVIEVAPASRQLYLDEVCGSDKDLRREVEALLDFDHNKADVLEQPAFSAVVQNSFGESARNFIGTQIGNYKITDELGVGGMGAVFLAERADGTFEQKVALKIVKRGMDTDAVLRRFFNERRILAALEHPNIAHLIDGGTTDNGLPYFVMEYVEGEPITDYATRKNLNLEERLKLFRQICSAVSFAHSNLVIHRDLKPSNILVTKDGTPKLLDFGIAKLLKSENAGGETVTQSFVFTPEYASPEQVRGEKLTTATDVYSLGVILYELLTDNRPYKTESRSISEIIRAVCETQPERPSSIVLRSSVPDNKQTSENNEQRTISEQQRTNSKFKIQNSKFLKGDLDNIILRALRKEPERRYSSVEQFSEDIRRHVEGLPVSASKDTWSYRASKFIQRNQITVAAAGLILLTLFAGLGATLYQTKVAQRERLKAEQRLADVRHLANSFLFEFHDAIQELSGSIPARKLVVSRALEYLDKLASESESDATLQRELGTAYERIGKIQGNSYHPNLGDTEGAMKSYQRSLEIRQRLVEADPTNLELQYELARSYHGVGDMFYTIDDLKNTLQAYDKGIAVLQPVVAAEPNNLKYLRLLADIFANRGDLKGMEGFSNLGDTEGALESYRQAIAISEKLAAAEPDKKEYQGDYATRLIYFGRLQAVTGDTKGAIASGQKSIAIFEKLSAEDPHNADYKTHSIIASNAMRLPLLDEGRTAEAVESARNVIKTLEEMVAKDPKEVHIRRGLGVTYNSLGECLLQAKDAKGAIESFRRALAIAEERFAADPKSGENRRDVSIARHLLAEAHIAAGEYDAALANLKQNISAYEEILKNDDSNSQVKENLSACYALTGKALAAKGDLNNAAHAFNLSIPFAEDVLQKTSPNIRAKSRFATYFFEAGKTFKKLAQNESGEKRAENLKESCRYFKRSFDLWNEMREKGTLSVINADRPDETSRELSACQ
jgi:eukaryotic-like serine/threonine-protein kinase